VLLDERGDAGQHVGHLLGRRHRLDLAVGQLERQVEVALVADVDHDGGRAVAHEQAADGLDRALGGRQPDADRPPVAQRLEPFQRQRQVGAPLVAGHGVDLVDDDRLDRAQRLAPPVARDQQVQRLGRGDDEARRPPDHRGPLRAGRVARAHGHADVGRLEAQLTGHGGDLVERTLEVLGDVDRQRLERRDVDDPGGGGHRLAPLVRPVERVDRHEEPRQRLARAGGGGDQRVGPRPDVRPPQPLGLGRPLGEPAPEPRRHRRMEPGQPVGRDGQVVGGALGGLEVDLREVQHNCDCAAVV
jgi:hypothetical protein